MNNFDVSIFGDEPSGEMPLTRVADALELRNTLFLVYLYAAFGEDHINTMIERTIEDE